MKIRVSLLLKKLDLRMKPWFKKTNRDEQTVAQTSLHALSQSAQFVKDNGKDLVHLAVPGVKGYVKIPARSFLLFQEMMAHVAQGRSVGLYHSDMELTTQQAADMLNVSRPHLVKLLETGVIPFKKMNTHRRIAVRDLMAFANKNRIALKLQQD